MKIKAAAKIILIIKVQIIKINKNIKKIKNILPAAPFKIILM